MGLPIARRRKGYCFRYHAEFIDSHTVAIYETHENIDLG